MAYLERDPSDPPVDGETETLKVEGKSALERTILGLRHLQMVHQIKTSLLGESYSRLGEIIWQFLCAVHLSDLEKVDFDPAGFQEQFDVSNTTLKRVSALLQKEGLISHSDESLSADETSLSLSEAGLSAVEKILIESKNAFTQTFIYSDMVALPGTDQ